jgi:hypothetical protein
MPTKVSGQGPASRWSEFGFAAFLYRDVSLGDSPQERLRAFSGFTVTLLRWRQAIIQLLGDSLTTETGCWLGHAPPFDGHGSGNPRLGLRSRYAGVPPIECDSEPLWQGERAD